MTPLPVPKTPLRPWKVPLTARWKLPKAPLTPLRVLPTLLPALLLLLVRKPLVPPPTRLAKRLLPLAKLSTPPRARPKS